MAPARTLSANTQNEQIIAAIGASEEDFAKTA
jgi:hypothetical protein